MPSSIAADRAWLRWRIGMFLRKPGGAAQPNAGTAAPKVPEAGSPLPSDVRAKMEPQLKADLSSVKVGTSGESAAAAEQLGARAFTVGNEIHFNAGEFAPGTREGDRLIAHELTHAVQGQRSGVQRKEQPSADATQDAGGVEVSQPGDPAEKEADAVGDHVAAKLHGDAHEPEGDEARPGKEQAPEIGAKLDETKIHRAGKDPLRGPNKDRMGTGPEANAVRVGNAVQAGVVRPPQHHVFPQEERAWFAARGVDVDEFCITLEQSHHEAIHARPPAKAKGTAVDDARKWEWNAAIMSALRREEQVRGRKLVQDEMIATARRLMPDYGLKGKFERYRGSK
jgi:hypothetical protein